MEITEWPVLEDEARDILSEAVVGSCALSSSLSTPYYESIHNAVLQTPPLSSHHQALNTSWTPLVFLKQTTRQSLSQGRFEEVRFVRIDCS